jgi:hypothetical protein
MTEKNNPKKTIKKYRNEQLLQIYLPLIAFVLIGTLLTIGVIRLFDGGGSSIAHWSNISAVFLIVPLLLEILITTILVIFLVIGLGKLIKWLPIYISTVYVFIIKITIFIMNGSNKITSPIINSRAKISSLKSIFRREPN